MSEPKSSSPPQPSSSNFDLYRKFYAQAYRLATSPPRDDDSKETETIAEAEAKTGAKISTDDDLDMNKQQRQKEQKIIITIDTIAKLIFGLDGKQKARFVLHGAGALELIMALVDQADQDKKQDNEHEQEKEHLQEHAAVCTTNQAIQVQTSALKAIKTCVLRNPAGRSRCRSAGVLTYINAILEQSINGNSNGNGNGNGNGPNATLAEEAFTTLAALSLGDDLNALEASTNVKPYIQSSKTVFADAKSMHQKTLYLETLFAAVEKEQEKLLQTINVMATAETRTQSFFMDLVQCETDIRTGLGHLQDEKYDLSFKHYNHAMNLISPFVNDTALLNGMVREIRTKRAQAALELGKVEDCLEDTSILLESKDAAADEGRRAHLLKMHGKALIRAGNVKEGRETLAKLMIICPHNDDAEVAKLLEDLKVDDAEE